ncbi:hypothetical protein G6F23_014671 [Rhizopus arrhizus]|nr:hypothetical protein G6F23_014671 [Rhizopus arrhizus]
MHDAAVGHRVAQHVQRDRLAALGRVQGQQRGHAGGVEFQFERAVHHLPDRKLHGFGGAAALVDEGQHGVVVQRVGGPALRHDGGGQRIPGGQVKVDVGRRVDGDVRVGVQLRGVVTASAARCLSGGGVIVVRRRRVGAWRRRIDGR